MANKVKRGKLVIEITEDEGRKNLLKRRDGIGKFLDNIDSMFKRGSFVRAVAGVTMFFKSEEGGTFGPNTEVKVDLSDMKPLPTITSGSPTPVEEQDVVPSDEEISAAIEGSAMFSGTDPNVDPEEEDK